MENRPGSLGCMAKDVILVTGASGLLGGRLCDYLRGVNDCLLIAGQRSQGVGLGLEVRRDAQGYTKRSFDLCNPESIEDVCEGVDVVVHLAGLNAQHCQMSPENGVRANGYGTEQLIKSAIKYSVRHFLLVSTVHVYGPSNREVTERSLCAPVHPYSKSKKRAEEALLDGVQRSRLTGTILRLSNSLGFPVKKEVNCWHLIANDLVRQAVTGHSLKLKNQSDPYRDFIAISDFCKVCSALLRRDASGELAVFNVSSANSQRLSWLVKLISNRIKRYRSGDAGWILDDTEKLITSSRRITTFNNDKLLSYLNFDPFSNNAIVAEIDELIRRADCWFRVKEV